MNHVSKITAVVAFFLIAAIPSTLAQSSEEPLQTYILPSFTVDGVADPELQSYITPRVPSALIGSKLTMYYTISAKGSVHGISSSGAISQRDLATIMTDALREWHFTPAVDNNGKAVAIRVAMPVEIMAQDSTSNAYVSIDVKGMKLVSKSS